MDTQRLDFQAKKRRLGTKQNDEVESQVRKRVKCEEGEGVEHNGSSEPQRSNTVHLSEKTKLKLSTFLLDSGKIDTS
ncbi:uncharacterized protein LOC135472792 isoform X2 [Liolophura sinensis]|uniref:uncharacterized protein LOC135472792 isoform X2 n=1 Tax=Liolophura sinensis TaxID=3198878 RepID=UPI00315807DC